MSVTLEDRMRPSPDALYKNLDGEAVLVSLKNSTYYGLDEVGTRIWELIQGKGSLGAVLEGVLAEYDVAERDAAGDLLKLVDELLEQGLLERVTE